MAYGKKSTPKIEIGDILFVDAVSQVYSDSGLSKKSFMTSQGQELGEVTGVTGKYYEFDFNDPYEDKVTRYIQKTAKVRPYANTDYDYPDSTNNKSATTDTKSSGGGFLEYFKTILGFGTEVLKATNAKNADGTDRNSDGSGNDSNGNNDSNDPNNTASQNSNKTWLYVAGAVVLIVLLVVIFWKPKPPAASAQVAYNQNPPVQYISTSNQPQTATA